MKPIEIIALLSEVDESKRLAAIRKLANEIINPPSEPPREIKELKAEPQGSLGKFLVQFKHGEPMYLNITDICNTVELLNSVIPQPPIAAIRPLPFFNKDNVNLSSDLRDLIVIADALYHNNSGSKEDYFRWRKIFTGQ